MPRYHVAEVFYTQGQLSTFFFFLFFKKIVLRWNTVPDGRGRVSPITLTFTAVNFQRRARCRLSQSTSYPPLMKGGKRANYSQRSHVSQREEATNLAVLKLSQHSFLP